MTVGGIILKSALPVTVLSALWVFAAFVKPGFINILNKKGHNLRVAVLTGISVFLAVISIVCAGLLMWSR